MHGGNHTQKKIYIRGAEVGGAAAVSYKSPLDFYRFFFRSCLLSKDPTTVRFLISWMVRKLEIGLFVGNRLDREVTTATKKWHDESQSKNCCGDSLFSRAF